MCYKINKWLQLLEDPEHPSLGLLLCLLKFCGLWHPELKSIKAKLKLVFFYIIVVFFFSQYVKIIIDFNTESLMLILKYAPFHLGILKACFFQKDYKSWEELVQFISSVERKQTIEKDIEQSNILKDYIRSSRRVSYFFISLAFFSNFTIFSEPFQENLNSLENGGEYVYLFEGYTPFRRQPPGYYYTMIIQIVFANMISIYVVTWDLIIVSTMMFFYGQLRICGLYCSRIVDVGCVTRTKRNIAYCHEFHSALVQNHRKANSLISAVMFFYLVIISVNLGVCIIQIAELENDPAAVFLRCVYIIALLIQLLLFYWYSNEIIVESEGLCYSTFKSDWVDADYKIQRQVVLLTWSTKKRSAFRAGPFNEMSLSTFIGILRRSYSFYTLLKGTN